jgi:hypothetical protein
LARFEFESGIVLFSFFIFASLGESRLLVSWCAGGKCGMACSDEDRGRSRRPGVEDRGWSHRSGTQWPGDREDVSWLVSIVVFHCVSVVPNPVLRAIAS